MKTARPTRASLTAEQPPTDLQLVRACASSDAAALGELFDRHHVAVYRFLSRLLGASTADVDELVSETFIHVFRSARTFRGQAAVRTWINAIAANVGRHHVRKEARRHSFLTALRGCLPASSPDANQVNERRDLLRRLGHIVATLPHDLRVVYVMCDVEEIPGVEVAEVLGVPEGTLWRRLHQARRALRAALDGGRS
jgi:RNA polymerase sigma-70 factor (ECF subfamily)